MIYKIKEKYIVKLKQYLERKKKYVDTNEHTRHRNKL